MDIYAINYFEIIWNEPLMTFYNDKWITMDETIQITYDYYAQQNNEYEYDLR